MCGWVIAGYTTTRRSPSRYRRRSSPAGGRDDVWSRVVAVGTTAIRAGSVPKASITVVATNVLGTAIAVASRTDRGTRTRRYVRRASEKYCG